MNTTSKSKKSFLKKMTTKLENAFKSSMSQIYSKTEMIKKFSNYFLISQKFFPFSRNAIVKSKPNNIKMKTNSKQNFLCFFQYFNLS